MHVLRCVVKGETQAALRCVQSLYEIGHVIAEVLTSNPDIMDMAQEWGIFTSPLHDAEIKYDIVLIIDNFDINDLSIFQADKNVLICYSNKNLLENNPREITWISTQNHLIYEIAQYSFLTDNTKRLQDWYFDAVIDSFIDLITALSRKTTLLKKILYNDFTNLIKTNIFGDLGRFKQLESHMALCDWNKKLDSYPTNKTIHQLFEEQVIKTPDLIAIIHEENNLTYRELNEKANQLANLLIGHYQIKPDNLIGLCLGRSEHMVVGILAVLKAGGAYIPIDPDYPDERIRYILDDIKTKVILCNEIYQDNLLLLAGAQSAAILPIDSKKLQVSLSKQPKYNPKTLTKSSNLAYVIYTSGTTGKPKGVMQMHGNVACLFAATNHYFHFNSTDVWTLFHSYAFDFSVWEIWGALIFGGRLVIPSRIDVRDMTRFYNLCEKNRVTILNQTPTVFQSFIEQVITNKSKALSFRYIIFGGEKLNVTHLSLWWNLIGDKEPTLINMYGITETTVHVTLKEMSPNTKQGDIGKVLNHLKAYVLDSNHKPVPIGVVGELFVGGTGLARGYLNQPELTLTRFIPNPFASTSDKAKGYDRLYKTGDLVSWLPDGNLEYIGRNDSQVKIRGHRIELGEIESTLNDIPQISQSVVIAHSSPPAAGYLLSRETSRLIAYLTLTQTKNDNLQESKFLFASDQPVWWPSVSDYGFYDDFIYQTLSENSVRRSLYLQVFSKYVKNKVVLDIGTGKDALLARLCLECGAKQVYAVELLPHAAEQAKNLIDEMGLSASIKIIEGDIRYLNLPEKIEVCVSQLIGIIGSAEGVIPILNSVRQKHLKPEGVMLPTLAKTYIVAIELPAEVTANPQFSQVSGLYVEEIFKKIGKPFNLRLGLLNFSNDFIISNRTEFEVLNFNEFIEINSKHMVTLEIVKSGCLNAFTLWSDLFLDEKNILDSRQVGLPMVFVLDRTYEVNSGDYIELECTRSSSLLGNSCDYHLSGYLIRKNGIKEEVTYVADYVSSEYGNTGIYKLLFKDQTIQVESSAQGGRQLKSYFEKKLSLILPDYMLPSQYVILDHFPLTINGKIDRKALPSPDDIDTSHFTALSTELQKKLAVIWHDALKLHGQMLYQESNFFELGGNSLNTMQIITRIHKELKVACPVRKLFELPLLKDLSNYLEKQSRSTTKVLIYEQFPIEPDLANQYQPFPLSDIQQAYWVGRSSDFEGGGIGTHVYLELLFRTLDIERLESSWNRLIKRHAMLRVIFENNVQRCLETVPVYHFKRQDLASLSSNAQEARILLWRNQLSHQLFDPSVYPLFDIRVSECMDEVLLHLSFDALMFDGFSLRKLMEEWSILYQYPDKQLPLLSLTFRDYQETIARIQQSNFYEADKAYWLARIKELPLGPDLPINTGVFSKKINFKRVRRVIAADAWKLFKEKADTQKISATSAISALYGLVLARWSRSPHFLINLTLFNRLPLHEEVNEILGDFTTLELLEFDAREITNLETIAKRVHKRLWEDLEHRLFTGVAVQRELLRHHNIPFTRAVAPVVLTSILGMSERGMFNEVFSEDFVRVNHSITQTPQAWIDHQTYEELGTLIVQWDYMADLLPSDTINAMHEVYCELLSYYAVNVWDKSIPELLPEYQLQMIEAANNTKQALPKGLLQTGFLEKATKYPKNTAIITSDLCLSYEELRQLSMSFTDSLINLIGHGNEITEPLIAIVMEKGYEQIVACLAILQSGLAYLPINACWPDGRIKAVLSEGKVKTVLTQKWVKKRCGVLENYKCLIVENKTETKKHANIFKNSKLSDDNIAYVIFTSGSTGIPKGVAITHQSAMNTIEAVNKRFKVTKKDRVLALSDLSFDLSVYDIFGLLAEGGTVVIPDADKLKEPSHWSELLKVHRITLWNSVPTFLQMLLAFLDNDKEQKLLPTPINMLKNLRLYLLSGDYIAPNLITELIQKSSKKAEIISLGGATEGSIWSIWHTINREFNYERIPYGTAMPNQSMFVFNDCLEHCPIGVIGEIYIGGNGIAKEYWQDAPKTRTQFIKHPKTNQRYYKTGDLGYWNKEGVIEILGRKDTQVKISGHRVELGEIENALQSVSGIADAVVQRFQKNEHYLVGYVVPDSNAIKNLIAESNKEGFHKIDKSAFILSKKGLLDSSNAIPSVPATVRQN